MQSHFDDWNLSLDAIAFSDASAARGLSMRRGLGAKLRHIQVRHLWLQQRVKLGHLKVATVRGIDNPADCLTKALTEAHIRRHCEAVGQRWLS